MADGIAFSCGNTKKPEASLKYILQAVSDTVYEGKKEIKDFDPDLKRWSNQGVLMLNTALTTEIGKIGKHYDIWDPFIKYLVDILNAKDKEYVWVFMGKKAQELTDLVDNVLNNTVILTCSHPASAAYVKAEKWNCSDVFNDINRALKFQNKSLQIVW